MATVLITGANRGIGLELAKQYAKEGWSVLATARDLEAAKNLRGLEGNIKVYLLDVSSSKSVASFKADLAGAPIDLLINNAGVGDESASLGSIDYEKWEKTLITNTIGPIRISEALLPNLSLGKDKKIATISSVLGSIKLVEQNHSFGGIYAYRTSKAAVNMAMSVLSHDLKEKGFTVLTLHPGWVKTDMGGPNAEILPEQSARGLRRVIAEAKKEDSGRYLTYEGKELPW